MFFLCILLVTVAACVTPHLGFPVQNLETPVEVTLFSSMVKKGTVNVQLGALASEPWKWIYEAKYVDMLSKVPIDFYQIKINQFFLDEARKSNDYFILNPNEVLKIPVVYSKKPDDPKDFSGYDFSQFKTDIKSRYVLALTVDDWGYLVQPRKEDSGPYMIFALRLIEKDTNHSVWEHKEMFRLPILSILRDTDAGSIDQGQIEDVYEKLLPKAVDKYFTRLRSE